MIKTSQRLVLAESQKGESVMRGLPDPHAMLASEMAAPAYVKELADSGPGTAGLPAGAGTSSITSPAMMSPLLEGFIQDNDTLAMNRLYREIYAYDPTVGSTIDLLSTLPLGRFSLTGLNDERRLQKYATAIENMKIRELLPVLSTDTLTLGQFLATTAWDDAKSNFKSLSPHNIDFATVEASPIFGDDPIVKLTIPPQILAMLESGRPEVERFRRLMPTQWLDGGEPNYLIDPKDLIYIARRTSVADARGTSVIKRCLPVCLMERALVRGTLDVVWKRQRSIVHLMLGDEDWKPTRADYDAVAGLFASADHDPQGAIIATRHGIDVNLIDRANEGLKYNDFYDFAQQVKLRALGLSDGMFSIDANVSVAEGAINLAMKHLEAYRDRVSHALFYRNVFPAIAVANRMIRQQSIVLSSGAGDHYRRIRPDAVDKGFFRADFSAAMPDNLFDADLQKYAMPKIEWQTNLEPTDAGQKMDMLARLTEQGLQVPLRTWATAAGVSLESLMEQRDNDIKLRKWLKPWRNAVVADKSIMDGTAQQQGGGDDNADQSSVWGTPGVSKKVGLINRRMDPERTPMIETGARLKPRTKRERDAYNDKANRLIVEASTSVETAKLKERNEKHRATTPRKFYTPA